MGRAHTVVLQEALATARLAGPLVVSQLSQLGMGFTDTVMAGHIGPRDLAAVAMGTSLWLPVHLACIGTMMALSPTVAQLVGAGHGSGVGYWFRQALWLAIALGGLAWAGVTHVGAIMPWLAIDPAIVPITRDYLNAVAWGMPAGCLYLAPRFLSEGVGNTRPIMYVQLAALGVNAVGNYLFMYGGLALPAMGAVGAGWSTALVLTLNTVALSAYVATSGVYRGLALGRRVEAPSSRAIAGLLRLGVPIAATMVMEIGLFTAVTLLMGRIGAVAVAAHQVALNYAALMFMIPLGLSMGMTIRVGQIIGAEMPERARLAGAVGMAMAVSVMVLSALVMVVVPERIAGMYTDDPEVAALAVELLMFAALFQVSDGLQVSAVGALRGLKDTAIPMLITFIAYWLLGLPLAWALGLQGGLGPPGLWVGLVVGLTVAAVLLTWRFHRLSADRIRHGAGPWQAARSHR